MSSCSHAAVSAPTWSPKIHQNASPIDSHPCAPCTSPWRGHRTAHSVCHGVAWPPQFPSPVDPVWHRLPKPCLQDSCVTPSTADHCSALQPDIGRKCPGCKDAGPKRPWKVFEARGHGSPGAPGFQPTRQGKGGPPQSRLGQCRAVVLGIRFQNQRIEAKKIIQGCASFSDHANNQWVIARVQVNSTERDSPGWHHRRGVGVDRRSKLVSVKQYLENAIITGLGEVPRQKIIARFFCR